VGGGGGGGGGLPKIVPHAPAGRPQTDAAPPATVSSSLSVSILVAEALIALVIVGSHSLYVGQDGLGRGLGGSGGMNGIKMASIAITTRPPETASNSSSRSSRSSSVAVLIFISLPLCTNGWLNALASTVNRFTATRRNQTLRDIHHSGKRLGASRRWRRSRGRGARRRGDRSGMGLVSAAAGGGWFGSRRQA